MIQQGITTTTFGERFHGALMSPILAKTKLQLQPMTSCSSKTEIMPINTTLIDTKFKSIDISKESVATNFGKTCKEGDTLASN